MTMMPYLFITVDELSSGACCSIVVMHPSGYAVLYRPVIDGGGAEIPDTRHIGALTTAVPAVPVKHIWYKVVPFGEIETKSSDPKHVGCTMGPSDGLGVLGLTSSVVI